MTFRSTLRSTALHLPGLGRVIRERAEFAAERDTALAERDALRHQLEAASDEHRVFELAVNHERTHATVGGAVLWVPPGHFYSPIPPLDDVLERHDDIFRRDIEPIGIDMRTEQQRALLRDLVKFYGDIPFAAERQPGVRYFYDNPAYSWSDGIIYHCMLRHLRPKQIIEIGSGYSSALALDTNELFLGGSARITFVEPYPELLRSLIRPDDACEIIEHAVQDVPLARFEELESGDILFIDSTHVARAGGDVNFLYFEVLPRLRAGVHVHIHDIFDAFEYPIPWIYEGRGWTEIYLLRALLIGNPHLEVQLMNTYMERIDEPWFAANMPNCLRNHGGSIWLRTA